MAGKKGGNTVSKVYEIAKPVADSLGLVIWDIEFVKEGALWYLRVLIENSEGFLDMDTCEKMTKPLSEALDRIDPIEQNYMLEVGSPGLGRVLKREEHFKRYLDFPVKIRYIREIGGVKELDAVLRAYNNKDSITVETKDGILDINPADTAFIRLDDEDNFDEG